MKLSELKVGDRVTVKQYGMERPGTVQEIGTFQRRVYHGSRDWTGTQTSSRGARVLVDGNREAEWFLPQQVVQSADAYAVQAKARRELEEHMTAKAQELTEAFRAAGFKYAGAYWSSYERQIKLTSLTGELPHLLEVLHAAAK